MNRIRKNVDKLSISNNCIKYLPPRSMKISQTKGYANSVLGITRVSFTINLNIYLGSKNIVIPADLLLSLMKILTGLIEDQKY